MTLTEPDGKGPGRVGPNQDAEPASPRKTPGVTADPGVDGLWSPEVRQLTAGLSMTVTLVAFESLSVATIPPVVSRHLGDLRLFGWVFSAFFLASLVGIVVSGAVCDNRGVSLPLVGGLLIFA